MLYSDLVTIIIPMYNCEKFIRNCLDSCLQQSYRNIEIIVIDDCSDDNCVEIVKDYAENHLNITLFKQATNHGKVAAVNLGLSHASGNYISFVDADDTINEHKISHQNNFLKANPDILFCGTQFNRLVDDRIIDRDCELFIGKITFEKFRTNIANTFCASSIMYRNTGLAKDIRFREFFSRLPGEDLDFISRLIELGPGTNIDYLGYNYQFNEHSITRIYEQTNREIFAHDIVAFLMLQRSQHAGKDSLNSKLEGLEDFLLSIDRRAVNHTFRKIKRLGINKNRKKLKSIVISGKESQYTLRYRFLAALVLMLSFIPYKLMYSLRNYFEKIK